MLALIIATSIGTVLGLVSGWVGGWVDSVIMRFVDMVLAVPTILVALALAIALGPSFVIMVAVIGLLIWPRIARILRGETLLIRQMDYVRYARVAGGPAAGPRCSATCCPTSRPTLLVVTTLEVGHVILVESSLSFLGAGIPAPQPSWGAMISDGRALIATGWWIALFPGLALVAHRAGRSTRSATGCATTSIRGCAMSEAGGHVGGHPATPPDGRSPRCALRSAGSRSASGSRDRRLADGGGRREPADRRRAGRSGWSASRAPARR